MSKDMLNIDDFMRERLGSHSEKEDPNAWLKMKALLDEEMPERAVPFYFRLRKPLLFAGAALLAGILCVGGYRMHALRSGAGAPGGSSEPAMPVANNHKPAPESQESTAPVKPTVAENNAEEGNFTPEENTSGSKILKPAGTALNRSAANESANGHKTLKEAGSPAPVPLSSENHAEKQSSTSERMLPASGTSVSVPAPATTETAASEERLLKPAPMAARTNAGRTKGLRVQPAAKSASVSFSAADNTRKHPHSENLAANKPMSESGSNPGTSNTDATGKTDIAAKRVDSINTIITVNKPTRSNRNSRTVTYVTDTVAEQKVALPETITAATETNQKTISLIGNLPAPGPEDQKEAGKAGQRINKEQSRREAKHQKKQFNGAAPKDLQMNSTASAAETSVTKATVNSKQKSAIARFVENLRIEEKAADAKRSIRNADHYFGFSVGGNYSLSSAADFRGIQFGPTSELVFNKHWSFFAALRYFNRSGTNRTVNDSYVEDVSSNVPDSVRGANHYFTIFTDSTTRRFNFSTVQSFELPLSVRYSFRNFYVMTGLNLVFTLPVNVDLDQKNEGTQRSHVVATNSTSKPIIQNPGSNYDVGSFNGRFGMGYIIGAGYRFAPAWHADFQLVNTFWDHSPNKGAKNVSKDFFRVPSVQFSIGFQFNRGTKKPTFGPTDVSR